MERAVLRGRAASEFSRPSGAPPSLRFATSCLNISTQYCWHLPAGTADPEPAADPERAQQRASAALEVSPSGGTQPASVCAQVYLYSTPSVPGVCLQALRTRTLSWILRGQSSVLVRLHALHRRGRLRSSTVPVRPLPASPKQPSKPWTARGRLQVGSHAADFAGNVGSSWSRPGRLQWRTCGVVGCTVMQESHQQKQYQTHFVCGILC